MINETKRIGADFCKFQIYNDELIKDHPDREFLKSIMIDKNMAMILFEHGREIGQKVFFTPMYLEAIDWLEEIGMEMYKVRFLDACNNKDLLMKCVETGKPVFASYMNDKYSFNPFNLYPIYCIPAYPATFNDYVDIDFTYFRGISDHLGTTELLERWYPLLKDKVPDFYYELHLKLDGTTPLENKWSVSFSELEEVLK